MRMAIGGELCKTNSSLTYCSPLQSNSPTLTELNLNNHTRADAEVISEVRV